MWAYCGEQTLGEGESNQVHPKENIWLPNGECYWTGEPSPVRASSGRSWPSGAQKWLPSGGYTQGDEVRRVGSCSAFTTFSVYWVPHFSWRVIGRNGAVIWVRDMPTLLLSVRAPLGSHSVASSSKLPDTSSDFFWMPGFSPPVLGVEDSWRALWCAVGHHERVKCDEWSVVSGGALQCIIKETTEDCIAAIAVRRAPPPQLGLDIQTCGLSALFPYVFLVAMRLRCTCCVLPPPSKAPPNSTECAPVAQAGPRLRLLRCSALEFWELWVVSFPGAAGSRVTSWGVVRAPVDCESKSTSVLELEV